MSIALEKLGVKGAVFKFPPIKNVGPVTIDKKIPYVAVVEQGLASAGRKQVLVPAGVAAGAGSGVEVSHASESQPLKYSPLPYQVNHVVIALDISGSMGYSLKDGWGTAPPLKLNHIKAIVGELLNSGFPENTKITLVTFNYEANIAKDTSGFKYEFRTDLETLIKTIGSLNASGGTDIFKAMELSHKKICELDPSEKERKFFILITDGQDGSGKLPPDFHNTADKTLKSNATSYVIGVGKDYKQDFLFDLASHLGPSVVGHTPSGKNPFTQYMPTILEDLQTNDHYLHLSTVGLKASDNYFPTTPGIRVGVYNLKKRHFEDYGGYQQTLASVSFAGAKNSDEIKYLLRLKRFATDKEAKPHELSPIDIDNIPPGLFELGEEAKKRFNRFLAAFAQMNLDVDLLRELHEQNPDLVSQGQIDITEARKENPDDPDVSAAFSESVADAATSIPNRTIPGSPSLGSGQMVNLFSALAPEEIIPSGSGESGSNPSQAGQSGSLQLHSGGVDRLDSNEASINVPPMSPSQIDPEAYGKAPKKLTLEIIKPKKTPPVEIKLDFKDKNKFTFGRSSDSDSEGHICIPNSPPALSRKHFSISRRDNKFYIKDLDSRNGTFVNDQEITEQILMPGDLIKVCDVIIKANF